MKKPKLRIPDWFRPWDYEGLLISVFLMMMMSPLVLSFIIASHVSDDDRNREELLERQAVAAEKKIIAQQRARDLVAREECQENGGRVVVVKGVVHCFIGETLVEEWREAP